VRNGGPAPESLTDSIYAETGKINTIRSCFSFPDVDLDAVKKTIVHKGASSGNCPTVCDTVVVEVIDPVEDYENLLSQVFDFNLLKSFFARPDFSLAYDGLSGGTA
jgi:phosphoglucomutase